MGPASRAGLSWPEDEKRALGVRSGPAGKLPQQLPRRAQSGRRVRQLQPQFELVLPVHRVDLGLLLQQADDGHGVDAWFGDEVDASAAFAEFHAADAELVGAEF